MSGDVMMFPDTVEEFMEQYKVVDREQVYSNGIEFVPIFRMKQWFDHVKRNPDDVRGVVHCSDCSVPHNEWTGCPKLGGLVTQPDFYCAFGERMKGH